MIIGLPAGSTELAYAVRAAFEVFRNVSAPVVLVPASVHSIKHDFDQPEGNPLHIDKILDHYKGRMRGKRIIVVDDNSSTGRTMEIMRKGLQVCKPASVIAHVAEADITRTMIRLKEDDLREVASPSLYARSVNVLPVSRHTFPRVDLKQLNERRRMVSCVRSRYSVSSENPINRIIGQVYIDLIKCPNMAISGSGKISSFRHTFLSNFFSAEVSLGGGLCCTKPLMSEVPLSPDGFIPRPL